MDHTQVACGYEQSPRAFLTLPVAAAVESLVAPLPEAGPVGAAAAVESRRVSSLPRKRPILRTSAAAPSRPGRPATAWPWVPPGAACAAVAVASRPARRPAPRLPSCRRRLPVRLPRPACVPAADGV